jgi:hypothetical protein
MNPVEWWIGPMVDGKNYSNNVPSHPSPNSDGTWYIDLPQSDGVHYVTTAYPSLTGFTKMTIRYRIEMADGVKIVPSTDATAPSIGPTLYFQRVGDNWNSDGYRWWATFARVLPMVAGENEVSAPLDFNWTSSNTKTANGYPNDFALSKQNTAEVGFTLGGGSGYGHGVYATGKARLIVEDFRLEP